TRFARDWSSDVCSSDLVPVSAAFSIPQPALHSAAFHRNTTGPHPHHHGGWTPANLPPGHMTSKAARGICSSHGMLWGCPATVARSEERRVGTSVEHGRR